MEGEPEAGAEEAAGPKTKGAGRDFITGMSNVGAAILVFVLGLVTGFPLASTGADFFTQYGAQVFATLFSLLTAALILIGIVFIFRQQIWARLFKRGEIEMERFARPLADVARFAAAQKVEEATVAARDLAELVLARYAWISTRRWMIATVTAFIAAIAALAGSALLFQQNELLRVQGDLMAEQTGRLADQNAMMAYQIELGEAERSAAILPEILDIGAAIGTEAAAMWARDNAPATVAGLSDALRARLVAATNAARPYRYLRSPLASLEDNQASVAALLRRTDLPVAAIVRESLRRDGVDVDNLAQGTGQLIDRPLSPERGQLLGILFNALLFDTETLSGQGADFSYAEVRVPVLSLMSLRGAVLRFADFSRIALTEVGFARATLDQARFRAATLSQVDFSAAAGAGPDTDWAARMSGADFYRARIVDTVFRGVQGFAIDFDRALLHGVSFETAMISGSTFREAVIGTADFSGADLKSVDFDQAIVFDAAFLTRLAAEAADGTFDAGRFRLEPMPATERDAHPLSAEFFRLGPLAEGQAFRVVRVGAFQ